MHTFFHGWRRKAGVVTLVMACALMGGWIRSYASVDSIFVNTGNGQRRLQSEGGYLIWSSGGFEPAGSSFGFESRLFTPIEFIEPNELWVDWRFRCPGIRVGTMPSGHAPNGFVRLSLVAYLMFVFPLTLLSAYLILWKPRKQP